MCWSSLLLSIEGKNISVVLFGLDVKRTIKVKLKSNECSVGNKMNILTLTEVLVGLYK